MIRKWLAVGIILLFVRTCIIPAMAQDTENNINPADRVFIKIFTAYAFGHYAAMYPAFCAIKIDGFFRGFSWKIGTMFDSVRCNYWSGYVLVGTHTLTIKTLSILQGFITLTDTITIDADSTVVKFWIECYD